MSEENPIPTPDRLQSPERVRFKEGMVALQSRLLLGGPALDPKKQDLPELTKEQLSQSANNFENTLSKLNNASDIEREDYWKKRNIQNFETQKKIWIEETIADFQNSQEYFKQTGMDKSFDRLGITDQSFNQVYLEKLYNTFFTEQDKKTNIINFYKQICDRYVQTAKDNEGDKINYEQLKRDLPAIQWLAAIFGENSSEVLTQLVDAVGKSNNPEEKEKLIAQANEKTASGKSRHNDPDTEETELLNFLLTGKRVKTSPLPHPEPKPTPKPEPHPEPKKITETDSYKIADALLDYDTGKPKDVRVDLSAIFPPFVNRVKQRMETDSTLFPPGGIPVVLSDLSYAMIDRTAESANKKNKELGFSLQGVLLTSGDEANHKNSLVAALASPSMDFQAAEAGVTRASEEIGTRNANLLAKNANLEEYFQNTETNPRGINVADIHIHYDALGERYRATPSNTDFNQDIPDIMRKNNLSQHIWGVATKSEGKLYLRIWLSQKKNDGSITHTEIPVVLQSQIEGAKPNPKPDENDEPEILTDPFPQQSEAEKKITVSHRNNLEAAQSFIDRLDESKKTAKQIVVDEKDPSNNRWLNKYGFVFTQNGYYEVGSVGNVRERYGFPMAIEYSGFHAKLVLKIFKDQEQWKMVYWNPYYNGELPSDLNPAPIKIKIIDGLENITDSSTDEEVKGILEANNLMIDQEILRKTISDPNYSYDLTFADDRNLTDSVKAAKSGYLQPRDDTQNCVAFCVFDAVLRAAAKWPEGKCPPEFAEFQKSGRKKFEEDFGITVATREQITS